MKNLNKYQRHPSSDVLVGTVPLGKDCPIRIQSMTNTDTMDTASTVDQAIKIIEAGAEYVRVTAQGIKEAKNIKTIKEKLINSGYFQPLIVDIHFNPKVAFEAAKHADKIRINPGNFADTKQGKASFEEGAERVKELFVPFLEVCKSYKTAIRIGVNHGSLSERMLNKYGDTPEGMVASCMEYLRIAQAEDFKDIVISIKSSNTRVMVHTVRLLVKTMEGEDMCFPLHLGVTEAGDGEDGRIKSAVGIGTLLCDGIGDTIRVSLSEAPEKEVPVANKIIDIAYYREDAPELPSGGEAYYSPFKYNKRESIAVDYVGGNNKPVVLKDLPQDLPILSIASDAALSNADLERLRQGNVIVVARTEHPNVLAAHRSLILRLMEQKITAPVIVAFSSETNDKCVYQLQAACELGGLFLDGLCDGILLEGDFEADFLEQTAYNILQASRVLFTKTEYISCPGCGRTLYNLEEIIAKIKARTSHLKDLKIGIMGCIVNGPGEMADADYGYVGAAAGKVSLYKGQECIQKNIPEDEALDKLIALIKEHGDWVEP